MPNWVYNQVTIEGPLAEVERFQEYGFTSVPHAGAEVVAIHPGGNRDHAIVITAGDRRYRLTGLAGGEMAIHDDQGQKVHIKRDGILAETSKKITAKAGETATVEAPEIHLKGKVIITGDIEQTGKITSTGQHIAASHD